MALSDRPLFTREFEDVQDFAPEAGSIYLYGVTSEPRSEFAVGLMKRRPDITFVEIRAQDGLSFETDLAGFEHVFVRRRSRLEDFVDTLQGTPLYIDITGLSHSIWAPLVRVCLERDIQTRAIYLEPATYSVVPGPDSGELFDLSERIEGIAPIPLFATLMDASEANVCFVALLGFEGVRFDHMLNEIQPPEGKVFPIIGVPGFRPQYPFDAYLGNAAPLDKYRAARNLKFARSNCPFALYYALEDLAGRFPNDQLKIGLIGTKPHALGAILFAVANPDRVEIIYDHVKRKAGRTRGAARCLVYGLSEFLPQDRRARAA